MSFGIGRACKFASVLMVTAVGGAVGIVECQKRKAIQTIVNEKLGITCVGEISAPYGARIGTPQMIKAGYCNIAIAFSLFPQVNRYLETLRMCAGKSTTPYALLSPNKLFQEGMLPLNKAEWKWGWDEFKSGDLGHVSKISAELAEKMEKLTPEEKTEVQYYARMMDVAYDVFRFRHQSDGSTSGCSYNFKGLYEGPVQGSEKIKSDGKMFLNNDQGLGVSTPLGEFRVMGVSKNRVEIESYIKDTFGVGKEKLYEDASVAGKSGDKEKAKWESIRALVFHQVVEDEKKICHDVSDPYYMKSIQKAVEENVTSVQETAVFLFKCSVQHMRKLMS